jgi:mRNA interferase MazF
MKNGEVWDVNFSPRIGDEISKIRPAVIINHDSMGALQLKIVIPVTDGIRTVRDWHVELHPSKSNGLNKKSIADCFQLKSISTQRLIKRRGKLSKIEMDDIKLCLMTVLDLL